MTKPVCVRIYNAKPMAEVAKGVLSSNNIEAVISGGDPAQPHVEFTAGVRLLVAEKDKQKALDILENNSNQ